MFTSSTNLCTQSSQSFACRSCGATMQGRRLRYMRWLLSAAYILSRNFLSSAQPEVTGSSRKNHPATDGLSLKRFTVAAVLFTSSVHIAIIFTPVPLHAANPFSSSAAVPKWGNDMLNPASRNSWQRSLVWFESPSTEYHAKIGNSLPVGFLYFIFSLACPGTAMSNAMRGMRIFFMFMIFVC